LKRYLVLLLAWLALPAQASVYAECVEQAALRYRLPPTLIQAVLAVEGGRIGAVSYNRDGSFDIGPMQINSRWLPLIEKNGGSLALILHHPCANIHFGAWLLARELEGIDPERASQADFWRAVGNYHSRTPVLNKRYAQRVWERWQKLSRRSR
jgi:soluble lytic murein transglycosylase-like protein